MFGVSWAELLVIMLVALVILGPERLPKAAETLGRVYGQLYRAWLEARKAVEAEADLASLKPEAEPQRGDALPQVDGDLSRAAGNGPDSPITFFKVLDDAGSAPDDQREPQAPSGSDNI